MQGTAEIYQKDFKYQYQQHVPPYLPSYHMSCGSFLNVPTCWHLLVTWR